MAVLGSFLADFHLEGDLRPCFLGGFGAVFHKTSFLSADFREPEERVTKECGLATRCCWDVVKWLGLLRRLFRRRSLWSTRGPCRHDRLLDGRNDTLRGLPP